MVNRRIYTKRTAKEDKYLIQARELYDHSAKINGSTTNLSQVANNLGYSFLTEENYEKAHEYFSQALLLKSKLKSHKLKTTTLNNIGLYFYQLNNYDSAYTYFSQAIDLNIKEKGYQIDQYDRSISINLYSVDELKKSLKYLEEINQKAPHLALKNQEIVYSYLNAQIDRIEKLKLIEVNEMLEEVNADIQKEKELANSVVTILDWLTYIGSILLLVALTVVSVKLRLMYIANQKRIKHNKRIIEQIKKGHSKE